VRLRREDLMSRDRPQSLQKAREDVYSGLASLPWLDVRSYIPKIASGLGLRQDEVENEIRRRSGKNEKSAIYAGGNDSLGSVYIYKDEGIAARDRELDLECAFCSLAWRDEEIRAGFSPSEGASIISLFSDEAAAGIVSALVSGESPDDLEERWRSIGERDCLARIARGDAVLAMGELGSQHVEKMVESLRMNMARRRYEQLKPLVLSEEATKEEIAEYHEWAKKLKGGGR
jgi:DNA primase